MKCYLCHQLENFSVTFNGQYGVLSGDAREELTFCCEHIHDIPGLSLCKTAKETIEEFQKLRKNLILAGQQIVTENANTTLRGCLNCHNFQVKEVQTIGEYVHFVNLSMYPSPCQCKCCYCGIHCNSKLIRIDRSLYEAYYQKNFEVIELMLKEGLIASDAKWQVSCSETSIHPFKDRILQLVEDKRVNILTNAFVYDKTIAIILENNSEASINLSIDAGTASTWKKVKGFDNFVTVLNNLKQYRSRANTNQITLKYILIPGINTSLKDFQGIVHIMQDLEISNLQISWDFGVKPTTKLFISKAILILLLHMNGLTHEIATI